MLPKKERVQHVLDTGSLRTRISYSSDEFWVLQYLNYLKRFETPVTLRKVSSNHTTGTPAGAEDEGPEQPGNESARARAERLRVQARG